MLSGNEIRQKFVEYFRDKLNHNHIPSSSLIPDNPTVLLTTAGMVQFVPIFLGYNDPPSPPRAVTYQKCARAGGKDSDIENVGRTPRHHTFFEMLGNFSFGDYFKEEIIPWAWEFVTEHLNLPKEKLWITIYQDDNEAFEIWKNKVNIPENRIIRCGKKDNFWGPPGPTGPCGPCTEIHYDLGENFKCGDNCFPGKCDCDRFVEIWNLVFMELFLDEEGNYSPLAKKNVDTGMGLERITMTVQNKLSTFETDLLKPILDKVCEISCKKYNVSHKTDISLRIITDHVRCVTFLAADGLIPGNIGRNYIMRMILRRALRHGKILGINGIFLSNLIDTVIEQYKCAYPELITNRNKIVDVIKTEEERFEKTIDRGIGLLNNIIEKTLANNIKVISGEDAFTLYDTFGFPLELTIEIAEEQNLSVNTQEFKKLMQEQKERAKQAHISERLTDDLVFAEILKEFGPTMFVGYEQVNNANSKIIKILKDGKVVQSAQPGDYVEIILDITPFYAESGGQVGDIGNITNEKLNINVINTTKYEDLFIHKCEITQGELVESLLVNASVDKKRRNDIACHHTATHLIHSALKKVLGDSVNQAGSMVAQDRARFDFSYNKSLTFKELKQIENWVNKWIIEDLTRKIELMRPEEAKAIGAIALFGEKYGDNVRVISYGNISKELCGGTHIENTGQIHLCKIISETALAAGIRRLEAVCGTYALDLLNIYENQVNNLSNILKVPCEEITTRVEKLIDEMKISDKKVKNLNSELALVKVDSFASNAKDYNGNKILSCRLDNLTADALKSAAEKLNDKLGNSIIVIGSADFETEKVTIIVKISDNLVKEGYNAGNIANQIAGMCGGRGGGKPNFAQAGAKDPQKLDVALDTVYDLVKKINIC